MTKKKAQKQLKKRRALPKKRLITFDEWAGRCALPILMAMSKRARRALFESIREMGEL